MSNRRGGGGSLQRAWIRARTGNTGTKFKCLALISALLSIVYLSRVGDMLMSAREQRSLPVERVCTDDQRTRPAKPLIVLVAGGSRSGTTYLYNLLRIVLRQRDPNTISGWYEDLGYATRYASPNPPSTLNFGPGFLDAYNSTGTTVLVKVHTLAHATRLFTGCSGPRDFQSRACPVDLLFLTHRDLGPQVNSLRRMGWGTRHKIVQNAHLYCRSLKGSARLVDKDWESPETWKSQAQVIAMCHEEWISAAGEKLALDMSMEKSLKLGVEERANLADDIIRSLPSHHEHASMNSLAAVKEADALRPLDCASWQAVNPITHLHRGHVSHNATEEEGDEVLRMRGYASIEADAYLSKWRRNYGYY